MTEKRFTSQRTDDYNYSDILDNGEWIGICHVDCEDDFVDKFNELHDENEHLKRELSVYRDGLRAEIRETKEVFEDYCECVDENKKLKKEIEQLKQELRIYRKVASCSNCHYHNYDWFEDGDEFEVCDKGNDVTDGICEDWEEFS